MMPDLGKYAVWVLSAYGASLAFLAVLIWRSWARSAKIKRQLAEAEKEVKRG